MHPSLKRYGKIVGYAVAVVSGFAVIAAAVIWQLIPNLCDNVILTESISPNGQLKAVVFSRGCGATSGFSTQMSLLRASDVLPNENGKLFVADTDHGQAPSAENGGLALNVRWIGDDQLRVEYPVLARVFKSEPSSQGVGLEYAPVK